jgi:hypothetical protein
MNSVFKFLQLLVECESQHIKHLLYQCASVSRTDWAEKQARHAKVQDFKILEMYMNP